MSSILKIDILFYCFQGSISNEAVEISMNNSVPMRRDVTEDLKVNFANTFFYKKIKNSA